MAVWPPAGTAVLHAARRPRPRGALLSRLFLKAFYSYLKIRLYCCWFCFISLDINDCFPGREGDGGVPRGHLQGRLPRLPRVYRGSRSVPRSSCKWQRRGRSSVSRPESGHRPQTVRPPRLLDGLSPPPLQTRGDPAPGGVGPTRTRPTGRRWMAGWRSCVCAPWDMTRP